MDAKEQLVQSVQNLLCARLRSLLAILGILVGTGAVVSLIYTGNMATDDALKQFKKLGTNIISMSFFTQNQGSSTKGQVIEFTEQDGYKLTKASNQIKKGAAYTTSYASYRLFGKELDGQIIGVNRFFTPILKIKLARGRFVNDLDQFTNYCDIGSEVAKAYKKNGVDPIGQQIKLGKDYFTIVGVLKPWVQSYIVYLDLNHGALIPLPDALALSKQTKISQMVFRLQENPDINSVQDALKSRMQLMFPTMRTQFRNPQQVIDIVAKQRATFSNLLIAIASISLLVGGIGVMNIMLVSVTERKREIGLLMAIGAKRRDILTMFLYEAIILGLMGGMLGVFAGIVVAAIIASISHWEFTLYIFPIVLGSAVSVLVGVVSGFYPAMRASRLDPIQVLHSD